MRILASGNMIVLDSFRQLSVLGNIYQASATARAARDKTMGYEPLILRPAPPVLVGGGPSLVIVGGRYGLSVFWIWVSRFWVFDPGENSMAHPSSIASSSPSELVAVIGAQEKSGGAVSATVFVVVLVAAYELTFVVVVVVVLVDWAGQGTANGWAAARFTTPLEVVVAGANSRAQSSPSFRTSPEPLVTVIGGQLKSGISSSWSGV